MGPFVSHSVTDSPASQIFNQFSEPGRVGPNPGLALQLNTGESTRSLWQFVLRHISKNMARLMLFLSAALVLAAISCGVAASSFDESNPIRLVSDALRDMEEQVVQVLGSSRHVLSFARFAHRFGKKYESAEEMKLRYAIFLKNKKLIRSTNRKGLSYTLAVNRFADWSWEEFARHRLGAAQNCSATTKGNHKLTGAVLPESKKKKKKKKKKKNWKEEGIVTPVKDQGHCGSCWTFSTTGALEAAYVQEFGKQIPLSEQQLVDCAGAFNNNGCSGGLSSQAFEYIKYNGGLDTEAAYPYVGVDGVYKFGTILLGVLRNSPRFHPCRLYRKGCA
ncbi:thiol protease aleurain-like [Pyrus x bretschneideri]|uniref:thiol protease aleurain-like n=1 Tax=Pyrus x bretschneideri TaxID=225117 RepID=UPI00202DEDDD|nr:thiol protease aleurain-like [Pyrus x bretschneideri]